FAPYSCGTVMTFSHSPRTVGGAVSSVVNSTDPHREAFMKPGFTRSRTALAVLLALPLLAVSVPASAQDHHSRLSNVPAANKKTPGYAPAHVLSPELRQAPVAQGSVALENPEGIVTHYGYQNDVASPTDPSVPQMVPATLTPPLVEAQKTE